MNNDNDETSWEDYHENGSLWRRVYKIKWYFEYYNHEGTLEFRGFDRYKSLNEGPTMIGLHIEDDLSEYL